MTIAQSMCSERRKEKLDKSAVKRPLEVGDSVLLRTPALDAKLVDSWEGPYTVTKKLGAVTHELDVGKHKPRNTHINGIRKFEERTEEIRRITMVLEADTMNV